MLRSYLKIAWRSLTKNKLTSFINIFGLGLSMSVGLMIMVRLQDALSYDKFHPSPERTYRITSDYKKRNGDQWHMASTPLPLHDALLKNSDVVESAVNVYPALNGNATSAGKELYINAAFTEPSFFHVFGFALNSGNAETALVQPNSIVINKNTAEKFFGNTDAIGQMIKLENGVSFKVTGVLNEAPGKSHLTYDAYASYSSVMQMEKNKILSEKSSDWFAFNSCYTYILIKKGIPSSSAETQLNAIAANLNKENTDGTTSFHLQSLNKISPGGDYLDNDIAKGNSWSKIYIEGGMALLILLAACFNYTNLTIARALTRAKEVGIRKISGAKRYQIYIQYTLEAVLLSLLSLAFAWVILSLIVRYAPFNDDYEFIPSSFHYNATFMAWSVAYAVFTGLIAGSSPAWILSAFKPLRVLKSLATAKILGKVSLQKTLIVFQYSLSLVLIIFLSVFYKQFSFMSDADPGFKKNNVMIVPVNGLDENVAAQKVSTISGVESVAASSAKFDKHFSGMNTAMWLSTRKDAIGLNYYYADNNFISSMQFDFVAGHTFPVAADDKERYILLNEKAAHAFGFAESYKAIGQKLWINDSTQLEVTGILKDFNYESAGKPIAPLAFRTKTNAYNYLYVQTAGGDKKIMEARVAAALSELHAPSSLTISWLADDLDTSNSQSATISLLGFLGFIALAVATLGLLGLVIYTVEVRSKEIGIRKIIGASERQLVKILSGSFVKLLLVSGLIAMPIGWFLSFIFLQNFTLRTSFSIADVMLCFLFLLGIGLFTIISQTYKAATANPAKSLRTE